VKIHIRDEEVSIMLDKYPVTATLPATDIKRAKQFYTEKLGLKVEMEDPSPAVMFKAGKNTMLYVYQRGSATKAEHTAAAFRVDNIEKVMQELKAKGLMFEEYDMPGLKTVNGIFTMGKVKGAWFKDTEGNILGLTEM
jgi:predicted enzyme related to lactoylglutathione lyase